MLRGPDDTERADRHRGKISRSTIRALAALGVLAACGAVVEDAGASWGAIYLKDDLGTAAAVAGLAFVALQTAMTIGRLTGDRVVDRFGQRTVVRTGGVVTAAGMGFALAVPSAATTLIGFAIAGLGVATLVPAAMHTGDELPGLPAGVGLTVVSVLLRVGFLASPPLVGLTADAVSLRVGLLGVVIAGTIVVFFSRVLLAAQPVWDGRGGGPDPGVALCRGGAGRVQARMCPSPSITHLSVVSSRKPIGPRACSFWVEMPISAPNPSSSPSTNRVDAFTSTAAASTSRVNRDAASTDPVRIASE